MPNRTRNEVAIFASPARVKEYLIKMPEPASYEFNMHKLFPERFPEGDESGDENRNYDWMMENVGSHTLPTVEIDNEGESEIVTKIFYDTARTPNNGLLKRLHDKTGCTIINEYEEEGREFEGTFECCWGECTDYERPGRPGCAICEKRMTWSVAVYDDDDGYICPECSHKKHRV